MDFDFRREIKQAQKMVANSDREIFYAKEGLKKLQKYIIKLGEYFKDDNIEVRDIILEEFENELYDYLQVTATEIMQIQENTLQILDSNPPLVEKIYNKIKDIDVTRIDIEQEEHKAQEGEEKCAEYEIELMLQKIRTESISQSQRKILDEVLNSKDEYQRKIFVNRLKEDPQFREAYEYIMIFEADSEIEKLKKFIKFRRKSIEQELIGSERKSLKLSGRFLKKYDFLQDELNLQNKDYESLDMKNMRYQMKTEGIEEDIGLENIFTDEYIDTLSFEQLTVLNAFWQNRFTKVAEVIKQAIFITDNLELWKMLEENTDIDSISNEKIIKTIFKMRFLDNISAKIRKSLTDLTNGENCKFAYFNYEKEMPKKFEEQYKKFFDGLLPECDNNLDNDLNCCQSIRNNINIIYDSKNNMIKKLLIQIEHNPKITNWGYIPEEKKTNKKILLGFDYPGFNMPLRLHTKREEIVKYLKTLKNDAIIPVYSGYSDMEYKGKKLTTKIFMPLTKKRESEIIQKNKNINPADLKYRYINHLGNLLTKKYKKINKIYPHNYINLETGEIGKKKNGKFISENEGR